jgi:hypothetical protein
MNRKNDQKRNIKNEEEMWEISADAWVCAGGIKYWCNV